ncbi:MAG: hypothetical protein ACUVSQ_07250 [Pseudanabaenaceae cyanobacterium]
MQMWSNKKRNSFLALAAWIVGGMGSAALAQGTAPITVFGDRSLSPGFDFGLDTANGTRNWAQVGNNGLCLNYPGGQTWGAAFITVGAPRRTGRTGRDFSAARTLSFEMRGQRGNESVQVSIKDATDADNGQETRIPVANLTTAWKPYDIPLAQFRTADLRTVYVPFQVVFGNAPANVCVRNIRYRN